MASSLISEVELHLVNSKLIFIFIRSNIEYRIWIKTVLTVLLVSGTNACQIEAIEFWILGVGSNWYLYNFGMIFALCVTNCSPAAAAIVENPNAAP